MFTQFQGTSPPPKPTPRRGSRNSSGKGNSTVAHACAECKRRKIRCDGNQPCERCVNYGQAKTCYYPEPRQRYLPSRRTVELLSASLQDCQVVLDRLFPSLDVASLRKLSREELLNLAADPTPQSHATESTEPSAHTFDCLEAPSSQNFGYDENERNVDGVVDDVNSLSIATDRPSSYVGISSVNAALKVILRIAPGVREFSAQTASRVSAQPSRAPSPSSRQETGSLRESDYVDAYFKHVHILIPMIHEPSFRSSFQLEDRTDSPWLALLNMVLALGSIAASTSNNKIHTSFFHEAKQHLNLDSFGSGRLETLQAMTLMGGFYLHYRNQPNMAYAITGAAIRMACALGLHREYPNGSSMINGASGTDADIAAQVRRRTWWSLFCADVMGSTTLGRPCMNARGPAVQVQLPSTSAGFSETGTTVLPLVGSVQLCKISVEIQDRLATSPILDLKQISHFDEKLRRWQENLHPMLHSTQTGPETLVMARAILKWRYQNLRVVLHRSLILDAALRGVSYASMDLEEKSAINKCRDLANENIVSIAEQWVPNQMSGWNGVWYLYQASWVSLLSLFWEPTSAEAEKWRSQVELVLRLLDDMSAWSNAGRKSREVLARIYDAYRHISHQESSNNYGTWTETAVFDSSNMDTLWDEMMWGMDPGSELFFDNVDFGVSSEPLSWE